MRIRFDERLCVVCNGVVDDTDGEGIPNEQEAALLSSAAGRRVAVNEFACNECLDRYSSGGGEG